MKSWGAASGPCLGPGAPAGAFLGTFPVASPAKNSSAASATQSALGPIVRLRQIACFGACHRLQEICTASGGSEHRKTRHHSNSRAGKVPGGRVAAHAGAAESTKHFPPPSLYSTEGQFYIIIKALNGRRRRRETAKIGAKSMHWVERYRRWQHLVHLKRPGSRSRQAPMLSQWDRSWRQGSAIGALACTNARLCASHQLARSSPLLCLGSASACSASSGSVRPLSAASWPPVECSGSQAGWRHLFRGSALCQREAMGDRPIVLDDLPAQMTGADRHTKWWRSERLLITGQWEHENQPA